MSAAFCRKPLRPVGNGNRPRVADGREPDVFQRRRRDIFVENRTKKISKLRQDRHRRRLEFKLQLARAADTLKRELQQDGICRPAGAGDGFGFFVLQRYRADGAPERELSQLAAWGWDGR